MRETIENATQSLVVPGTSNWTTAGIAKITLFSACFGDPVDEHRASWYQCRVLILGEYDAHIEIRVSRSETKNFARDLDLECDQILHDRPWIFQFPCL